MQDRDLYQRILGLTSPWSVARVELNVASRQVDLWVEHAAGVEWACPRCPRRQPARQGLTGLAERTQLL